MTDLYDHETFLSHLETLVKSANDSTAFCLVMMDLDDFKSVNDTYGHDCGDQVLLFFAQAMQKRCDQSVTAYRYGGEEFALIFQNRSIGEVCWVTHDILSALSSHRFPFTAKSITCSAGISQYRPGITADALFEAADKSLYKAKRIGKNQISIDEASIEKAAQ